MSQLRQNQMRATERLNSEKSLEKKKKQMASTREEQPLLSLEESIKFTFQNIRQHEGAGEGGKTDTKTLPSKTNINSGVAKLELKARKKEDT